MPDTPGQTFPSSMFQMIGAPTVAADDPILVFADSVITRSAPAAVFDWMNTESPATSAPFAGAVAVNTLMLFHAPTPPSLAAWAGDGLASTFAAGNAAFGLLPSAFCPLPAAFCPLASGLWLLASGLWPSLLRQVCRYLNGVERAARVAAR